MAKETEEKIETLIAAHHARLNALMAGDRDAVARVVAEDMHYVSAVGHVQTRADVFEAIGSGELVIEKMESRDLQARIYGDIGILIYAADTRMRQGGRLVNGMTRSTTVYERRAGNWMMISQHQSSLET